jgi:hypothetical protein
MITIYHGIRPALPQAACNIHLGGRLPAGLLRNWRANPLWVAGKDTGGNTVCCLVHGCHHGLYRRALAGIASLFGITVRWVDTDALLWKELKNDFSGFVTLMLFTYFPGMTGRGTRRSIDHWIGSRVLDQQEERR